VGRIYLNHVETCTQGGGVMTLTCLSPQNLEMLALSNQGLSAGRIAPQFGITRNAVIGRLIRVREALAREAAKNSPQPLDSPTPSPQVAEESAVPPAGLVAHNSHDRGAHLDSLIWKRSSYLAQLREEGGL
jgi:hypothetical protein